MASRPVVAARAAGTWRSTEDRGRRRKISVVSMPPSVSSTLPVQLWQRVAVPHRARIVRHAGQACKRVGRSYTRPMREHDLELLELPAVLARLAAATASDPGALPRRGAPPVGRRRRGAPAPAADERGDLADRRLGRARPRRRDRRRRGGRARGARQHARHPHADARRPDDSRRRGGHGGRSPDRDDLPALLDDRGRHRPVAALGRRGDRACGRGGRLRPEGLGLARRFAACAASSATAAGGWPSACARSRAIPRSPSTSRTTSSPSAAAVRCSR